MSYCIWRLGYVPFGMYLDDDEDISILSELASSEFNGFVINKVFEYLNNSVGFFFIIVYN